MTASVNGVMSRCARPRRGAGPAQVATTLACSMRKSAGRMSRVDAGDAHPLRAAALAGDDGNRSLRDVERLRDHLDEFGIRRAVDRSGVEADEQRAVAR